MAHSSAPHQHPPRPCFRWPSCRSTGGGAPGVRSRWSDRGVTARVFVQRSAPNQINADAPAPISAPVPPTLLGRYDPRRPDQRRAWKRPVEVRVARVLMTLVGRPPQPLYNESTTAPSPDDHADRREVMRRGRAVPRRRTTGCAEFGTAIAANVSVPSLVCGPSRREGASPTPRCVFDRRRSTQTAPRTRNDAEEFLTVEELLADQLVESISASGARARFT